MHHSSEDYNLTTALRQSAFQGLGSWVQAIIIIGSSYHNDFIFFHLRVIIFIFIYLFQPLYLPMAFFVPPAQAVIHKTRQICEYEHTNEGILFKLFSPSTFYLYFHI